ncbi:hypothetical protein B586_20015 [Mycobacterium haemophilum DSM 44634]|nr:hypothetical protein B586_20015 [Mycobacterium haemophilum DSM 44634]
MPRGAPLGGLASRRGRHRRGISGRCRRSSRRAVAGDLFNRFVEGPVKGSVERLVEAFGRGFCGHLFGALIRGRFAAAKRFAEPASDRCLDRRRCGLDEFALLIQPGEDFFAGNTEFLSQLVYAGLTCHYISCL